MSQIRITVFWLAEWFQASQKPRGGFHQWKRRCWRALLPILLLVWCKWFFPVWQVSVAPSPAVWLRRAVRGLLSASTEWRIHLISEWRHVMPRQPNCPGVLIPTVHRHTYVSKHTATARFGQMQFNVEKHFPVMLVNLLCDNWFWYEHRLLCGGLMGRH